MNIDDFLLDEVKHIRTRYSTHESIRHQMLTLCITGYATVLGFSDKIPHEVIPYILAPLLFITSYMARDQRVLQNFNVEFLIALQEKHRYKVSIERAYREIMMKPSNKWRFYKFRTLYFDPFLMLTILSVATTFYFGLGFIKNLWFNNAFILLFVYSGLLFLIYWVIIFNHFLETKIELSKFREESKQFLNSKQES